MGLQKLHAFLNGLLSSDQILTTDQMAEKASPSNSSSDDSTTQLQSAQDLINWGDELLEELSRPTPSEPFNESVDICNSSPEELLCLRASEPFPESLDISEDLFASQNLSDSQDLFGPNPSEPFNESVDISEDLLASQNLSDSQELLGQTPSEPLNESVDISTSSPEEVLGPRPTISFPESVDTIEEGIGTQAPSEFYSQEISMTQELTLEHNQFATWFHCEGARRLQNSSLVIKPDWEMTLYHYGVLCSQFLQRYLSERFPTDPEKRKKCKSKMKAHRDDKFGNSSNHTDPRPGPSGIKRTLKKQSPSPPKKMKKYDSSSTDDSD